MGACWSWKGVKGGVEEEILLSTDDASVKERASACWFRGVSFASQGQVPPPSFKLQASSVSKTSSNVRNPPRSDSEHESETRNAGTFKTTTKGGGCLRSYERTLLDSELDLLDRSVDLSERLILLRVLVVEGCVLGVRLSLEHLGEVDGSLLVAANVVALEEVLLDPPARLGGQRGVQGRRRAKTNMILEKALMRSHFAWAGTVASGIPITMEITTSATHPRRREPASKVSDVCEGWERTRTHKLGDQRAGPPYSRGA